MLTVTDAPLVGSKVSRSVPSDRCECADLTLESGAASGMNLDGQDLTISSSQVALLSCDLHSHAMPEGLAIVSAMMRVRTLQQSGISLS